MLSQWRSGVASQRHSGLAKALRRYPLRRHLNRAARQGYMARVAHALEAVAGRARTDGSTCLRGELSLGEGRQNGFRRWDKVIIFSDLHRGARNAADEFRRTERAYRAALAYYLRLGHTLVVLGDAEELWEERPQVVLDAYRDTFALEAQFHQAGRYVRVWGNHDDAWQFKDSVQRYLHPIYAGSPLVVYEGVLLDVTERVDPLGNLLLVHGHQGDARSDQWAWFSRWVIRWLWRPYQRLTQAQVNTPATKYDLRHKHNRAMYAWAERQSKLVLIAGHTHHPVFRSMSHEAHLSLELAEFEARVGGRGNGLYPSRDELEQHALLLSRLEWVRTEEQDAHRQSGGVTFAKPCYFNTGCCCYDDGDITGIEIAEGEIRLVRWPDDEGEPRPHILTRDALRDVLAAC